MKLYRIAILLILITISCQQQPKHRKITIDQYIDKMKAGWIGQMVGVGWGGPTEFKWLGEIIPKDEIPEWKPNLVNQHYQDDIYVEMTFLRTLEKYGWDVSVRQAGIDFANSRYALWHANNTGRDNLRSGIAPPFSGHPKYNSHADDIDYQIEADYSGLIAPDLPQAAIDLGEKFGRLMNYGDGLYGGQFVAGMYCEAFFESDIEKIILAGLNCIPEQSMYAECISDVMKWYRQNPDNWKKTWHLINEKYHKNPEYRKFSCTGAEDSFNIDAKLNGAYIAIGLLYGKGNIDSTIVISTRCGQDSDCNPSNAAGILFTTIGFLNLPQRFKSEIDNNTKFSFTEYNFPDLITVCEKLARQAVVRYGGHLDKDNGDDVFIIPVQKTNKSQLEQCWNPVPIADDIHFTEDEMKQIQIKMRKPEEFVNKWQLAGPYSLKNVSPEQLIDIVFPPEKTNAENIDWQEMPMGKDGYSAWIIQLDRAIGGENRVAYLKTQIWSDKLQNVILELGSDDGVKVWLNNELVHTNNVFRAHTAGEDKINITLKKGWNSCLLKITQGTGGWEASLCITDENGNALKNLNYQ